MWFEPLLFFDAVRIEGLAVDRPRAGDPRLAELECTRHRRGRVERRERPESCGDGAVVGQVPCDAELHELAQGALAGQVLEHDALVEPVGEVLERFRAALQRDLVTVG